LRPISNDGDFFRLNQRQIAGVFLIDCRHLSS
jgi:hypothetical protein